MTQRQRGGLLGLAAMILLTAVAWALFGGSDGNSAEQQEVLAELNEVVENNNASTNEPATGADDDTTTSTTADADETTTTESTGTEAPSSSELSESSATTGTANGSSPTGPTTAESSEPSTTGTPATDSSTSVPESTETTTTAAPDGQPAVATFEIVETIPHDTGAFTQGFEISNGRLFESTGLVGESSIRELDLTTGEILRNTPVPTVFAEGLTIVGDTALQLTWKDGVAFRYDLETFELIDSYSYEGEGWGLCQADDGDGNLVMSDGSAELEFRNPDTFESLGSVEVVLDGAPIMNLNELECVGNRVWANIWLSSLIIEIDPATGMVLTVLDADSLRPESTDDDSGAVWNGLAYDPSDGTLLVTGKRWPAIYRLELATA